MAQLNTRCCIVGGGPCGMMLAYLLARAGIEVVLLEKHADFLRDFRGDTIHPSTLELMGELGLLADFLKLPHQEVTTVSAFFGQREYTLCDFSHLPTRCKFLAFMPQWDFLNFLADRGKRYAKFDLRMQSEATDLIEENGRVGGVIAQAPQGRIEIKAHLTVGCDGRHSLTRARSRLPGRDLGAPMDVLWFRLPKKGTDHPHTMGRVGVGHMLVLLDRGDYWQCAYVIRKGSLEETRRAGLAALRESIVGLMPRFADRVDTLQDWEQIKLLSVAVDRLEKWYRPGLLCIGDAAHAMSPIGGVGINLAVQDAVAAANILWQPLASENVQLQDLDRVQERRMFPTRVIQAIQLFLQEKLIAKVLRAGTPLEAPSALRLVSSMALLQRLPARLIGMGVRPEHVHSPERARA
jgi:2-polyprenyl-6-methoxyphenol hydroxylase-like FAD-dependent oxidoreductase